MYIDDEACRRCILVRLNRGEDRHRLRATSYIARNALRPRRDPALTGDDAA